MTSIQLNPLLLALGCCTLGACGDNDVPPLPPEAGDEAVVLIERVFAPEGRRYAISVLPEVPTGAIDRSTALVLTSADPELFEGKLYVRDRDANTMTRYVVSADRTLVQDGQFSFASTGLGASRSSSAYVSPELAYVMDSTDWRLIGWNPTTMALTGEIIALPQLRKDPSLSGSFSPAVKVGDRLIATVSWADRNNLVLYPGSGALVIDPAAPSQPKFIEDARVGGAFRVTADGDDAYVTGTVGGDFRKFGRAFGGGPLPASGLIRLPAGADAFDADFLVDIEAITTTKSVWAVHRIDDTSVLAQVYDPELPDLPDTQPEYNMSTDFVYVTIDTAAETYEPVGNLPRGGRGNAGNHVIDGQLYIQITDASGDTITYAVSPGGITEAFPVASGDLWFLARIR